jgi:hypothetical protein
MARNIRRATLGAVAIPEKSLKPFPTDYALWQNMGTLSV